jgi:hypothetical protein
MGPFVGLKIMSRNLDGYFDISNCPLQPCFAQRVDHTVNLKPILVSSFWFIKAFSFGIGRYNIKTGPTENEFSLGNLQTRIFPKQHFRYCSTV